MGVDDTFSSTHHWIMPNDIVSDAVGVRTRLRDDARDMNLARRR